MAPDDPIAILRAAVDLASSRSAAAPFVRRLAEHLAALERCPPERRASVAAALRALHPQYAPFADAPIACAYHRAPLEIRARLALGETPAQISGGLTRAEAHRWLLDAPHEPAHVWLASTHELECAGRSVAVVRWTIDVLRDPARRAALERPRVVVGPHGEAIHGRLYDRVDELVDRDLRPSVDDTFRRAGERLLRDAERLLRRKGTPLAPTPAWWRPARCARLLLSAAALVVEGRDMRHCVASYAGYVRRGDSVIVALNVCGHRSTVELDRRTARVVQHKGPRNEAPHALCVRALEVLARRWAQANQGTERMK